MVFDITGYIGIFHFHGFGRDEVALHFTIQTMSHEFEHDVGIAVNARALALQGEFLKYLVDIGQIGRAHV